MSKIGKRVLAILLSLSMVIIGQGGIPLLAEGTGTRNSPYVLPSDEVGVNPFPDKLSDEEINAHLASAPDRKYLSTLMVKYELVLKDGQTIMLENYGSSYFQKDLVNRYGDKIQSINWYMFAGESTDGWDSISVPLFAAIRHLNSEFSYDSGAFSGNLYPQTSLQINGQSYDPSMQFFEFKQGAKGRFYFSGSVAIDNYPITYFQAQTWLIGSNSSPTGGAAGFLFPISIAYSTATFHYVDETKYLNAVNLSDSDQVTPRSGGVDWRSTAPGTVLNLKDLNSVQVGDSAGSWAGALQPYFSTDTTTSTSHYIDLNTHQPVDGQAKPTYAQLISNQPLGYVYITDDIDKPANPNDDASFKANTDAGKGNYYLSPIIWPDGTITFEKHYYLLERAMYAPVQLVKQDQDGKPLKDAEFSLYLVDNEGKETLLSESIKSDEKGQLYQTPTEVSYADLQTITKENKGNYLELDGSLYLKAGTYRLKETKAPKGYKAKNIDFTVKAVNELFSPETTTVETVPTQSFAFQNEKAPDPKPEDKPTESKTVKRPSLKTGTSIPVALYAGIGMAALVLLLGLLFLRKKR